MKQEQTKTVQQSTKQVVDVTNEKVIEEERVVEHGTCSTCVKAKPDFSKAIAIAVKGELPIYLTGQQSLAVLFADHRWKLPERREFFERLAIILANLAFLVPQVMRWPPSCLPRWPRRPY